MSNWAIKNREKIKYIMGSKCCVCGYDKCNRALHVHHLSKEDKTFEIANLFKSNNRLNSDLIKKEFENCCLLCANCHAEIHDSLVPTVLHSTFDIQRWNESCKICIDCNTISNNPFYLKCGCKKGGNTLSSVSNKIDWNTIDVLLLLHRNDGNFSSAGRELSISDNAVRKAFRKATGYRFYEDYLKEKDIFSFDNDEVTLNHVFVKKF